MRISVRLDGGVDARAVTWFLRLLGAALVADVVTERAAGVWRGGAAPEHGAFETVKQQLSADLGMLREVSSTT